MVLASASGRRLDILQENGFEVDVVDPGIEEERSGRPERMVVDNAGRKAHSVAKRNKSGVILGADTLVVSSGNVLGKPADETDAERMLRAQLGSVQEVLSGVFVLFPDKERFACGYERSKVRLKLCGKMDDYLDSGQWRGKAGGFGIQDGGPVSAELLMGNEDNVIGLPMGLLSRLLGVLS